MFRAALHSYLVDKYVCGKTPVDGENLVTTCTYGRKRRASRFALAVVGGGGRLSRVAPTPGPGHRSPPEPVGRMGS